MPDRIRRALPIAAVLAVIIGCVVVARRADHEAARRAPATCLPTRCYCEAIATTGVRQPIDAWSSLAPALAGAACLASARRRPTTGRSPIARSRAPGVLLGIAACAIALFSFYYHATLTWPGEWLDGVALYLLAGFAITWWCARSLEVGGRGFAGLYGGLAAAPALASWLVPALRKPAFLAIAAAAIALVLAARRRTRGAGDRWRAIALVAFGGAMIAWTLDATRTVCDAHGPVQLHAVWHLLSAPTIIALDRYAAAQRAWA